MSHFSKYIFRGNFGFNAVDGRGRRKGISSQYPEVGKQTKKKAVLCIISESDTVKLKDQILLF